MGIPIGREVYLRVVAAVKVEYKRESVRDNSVIPDCPSGIPYGCPTCITQPLRTRNPVVNRSTRVTVITVNIPERIWSALPVRGSSIRTWPFLPLVRKWYICLQLFRLRCCFRLCPG